MTIHFKQVGDEIHFGTDERNHVFQVSRIGKFSEAEIAAAQDDLTAAYPDDADTIKRYADRLRGFPV